jgi:DNA-binding response OmpR family regulator
MRVLLVEDDPKAARLLTRGLHEEGFVVDVAASAEQADERVAIVDYDVIVLDWLLPEMDGITLCRELRRRGAQTPILMLTARDALADRVSGLDAGADDYLTKPFAFEELLARIRALLRRSDLTRPVVLTVADLSLDPIGHRVTRGGVPLDLTPKEYAILEILIRRPGAVVSRVRLAEQVWEDGQDALGNLIDVHVSRLRRKLDPPDRPPLLQTVRGLGYRLAETAS